MKRAEILSRLGFAVPDIKKKRVIVHSDIAAEADDFFAVAHHLLTPTEDVRGIICANFEWRFRTIPHPAMQAQRFTSMEKSYAAGRELLEAMDIDDVPLFRGAVDYIADRDHLPVSEGSRFIIEEAMRDTDEPLYIALQGGLTDLAVAYLTEPRIAERITAAIWIGGGNYPDGGRESNLQQDIYAAQVLFASPMPIWQVPMGTYAGMNISFAELMLRVRPCGEPGALLVSKMMEVNDFYGQVPRRLDFPHGELWSIGDQPTVSVLLENAAGRNYHVEKAPRIRDDMTYEADPDGKEILVFDSIDRRLTMEDLFAKLLLCYGSNHTSL
ncbi:MAG: nucleoside hydrolase [Faecousia sp.]